MHGRPLPTEFHQGIRRDWRLCISGPAHHENAQATATQDEGDLITEPQESWDFENEVTNGAGNTLYHSLEVVWYSADWYSSRGWTHDMAISGVASCRSSSDSPVENIDKNRYYMQVVDEEDMRVDPDQGDDFHGVYPSGGSSGLPAWVEIPTAAAISTLSAPAGFALTAKELVEAMEPEDGYNIYDYGYGFQKTPGTWTLGWTDASHFQRFMFESQHKSTIGRDMWMNDVFKAISETSEITVDIEIWKDDTPEVGTSDTGGNSEDQVVETTNPNEMSEEQKEKFGVSKVEPEVSTSGNTEKEQPEFRATNIPITITKQKSDETTDKPTK